MRRALSIPLLLALASCVGTGTEPVWIKPGTPALAAEQDFLACAAQARRDFPPDRRLSVTPRVVALPEGVARSVGQAAAARRSKRACATDAVTVSCAPPPICRTTIDAVAARPMTPMTRMTMATSSSTMLTPRRGGRALRGRPGREAVAERRRPVAPRAEVVASGDIPLS